MKVLIAHNRYQIAGGEDTVVAAERALLQERGHEVFYLEKTNLEITGAWATLKAAGATTYSPSSRRWLAQELARVRPDVAHVHNFFPLISTAVYDACRAAGVPVVQTLHNYRLICPNALCFRDGQPCEDCVGKFIPWPGVLHACYRQSRPASAAVATMLTVHRLLGTWANKVSVYIALTEFARQKFITGGLPAEKIVVKPNFAPSPGQPKPGAGDYALYVGRLSEEKGIATLLAAWSETVPAVPLKIVGDGPVAVAEIPGVEFLGRRSGEEVRELMAHARVLIFPSVCYETFGKAIIEAFAAGLPVVASNLGAMAELVQHERTGLLFRPGDPADLARKVEWAFAHPVELAAMRAAARAEYEAKYTPARNYEMLMAIYQRAIGGGRP